VQNPELWSKPRSLYASKIASILVLTAGDSIYFEWAHVCHPLGKVVFIGMFAIGIILSGKLTALFLNTLKETRPAPINHYLSALLAVESLP